MKKSKKLTVVQKLERKISMLSRILDSADRRAYAAQDELSEVKRERGMLESKTSEQERIIDMFKSCIDKHLLSKVLKDDHIDFLTKKVQHLSQTTVKHLHGRCLKRKCEHRKVK